MTAALGYLAAARRSGQPEGIASVCSAHPLVLRAALRHGREHDSKVLIEATCNQVNHLGGYTGMQPADFAALVAKIAGEEGFPADRIILGGDHLGPNPWRHRPAEDAMKEAERMVAAFIKAGFRKIHLDASMGCKGEPAGLDDQTTAERALRLATVAEDIAKTIGAEMPFYIIGTEVPPPGGADHILTTLEPTSRAAARQTINVHRDLFKKAARDDAFSRVIGLVVQPGVEFGNHNVIQYDRDKAKDLVGLLDDEPQFVFEAHSTDYQGRRPLRELVDDGCGILKVGPELTFVLRETLYALDLIASDLLPDYGERPLYAAMEGLMSAQPNYWKGHYGGDEPERRLLRHYSFSDRIRYYWVAPQASAAVERLLGTLAGARVPIPLLRQHLPAGEQFASAPLDPQEVLMWRVMRSLDDYHAACRGSAAG
ncbi:D-tagatose-bisphosphate aldolase, class II, non-catalytic subunit [Bradyrhizobium iriomotense]|uniref:D-tagatose-bisphosphate aldolase, class II, non-catalytic subunit n=1 Tax=Bradyrhizobium iriomotense TaxID=441950 RepID=A0ABQ6ATC8_9BRAD|nr:D-tagatose-bisphosphate aldolase, class II, non-catalytic subunit [Bradyrhizobium iriomotense]GLR85235.1 D-tagatose-bisphosphate aldolase, class II, non-catalytic subunit [Bradyrhizobium iriomotense]